MDELQFEGVFGAGSALAVTDFVRLDIGGATHLAGVSRNGLTVFREVPGGGLTPMGETAFASPFAPGVPPGMRWAEHMGPDILSVSGFFGGGTAFFRVGGDGQATNVAAPAGWPLVADTAVDAVLGSTPVTLVLDRGAGQLRLFDASDPGSVVEIAASAPGLLTGAGTLAVAEVSGAPLALITENGGTSVSSFRMDSSGEITAVGRFGVEDGLGLAGASQLTTVALDGATYAIVAGSGSSTLSVLSLVEDGRLDHADHIADSLTTRFQSVSALAALTIGGHGLVFAGGADDGVTAFLLLPDGRLHLLAAFEDTPFAALQNVTGLSADTDGQTVIVSASSESETGVTRLSLDLSSLGQSLVSDPGGGLLNGGLLDDVLAGGAGDDTLGGGGGADILVDGAGVDRLIGGAGADTFVFVADGEIDEIIDFEPGIDRIDLSRIPLVFDPSSVAINPFEGGAELLVRGEVIRLTTADGSEVDPDALRSDLEISVNRPFFFDAPIEGTEGADTLTGTSGGDTIIGGGGDDRLVGGPGFDTLDGGAGSDTLAGGSDGDLLIGGEGNDVIGGGDVSTPSDDWWWHRTETLLDPADTDPGDWI